MCPKINKEWGKFIFPRRESGAEEREREAKGERGGRKREEERKRGREEGEEGVGVLNLKTVSVMVGDLCL
tara:strand:+ start:235 stop:444 length:210 start_codon:yes stop_codon:yes gene_type:complete